MASQEDRSNNARTRLRQGSIADLEFDCFPKTSSYEDTVRQLDIYYGIVKRQILRYQSPITGLFPVISIETKVGSVRDSIYCATAIWSLYQAYRRIDDDRGKSHELGQSAVKCMRGILECWIRQAARVESFKMQQCDRHALHCKFHLITGDEVFTHDEYHHLQIDVVSLYLLMLVQMITSGLQIIYTQDEVAFVQNLVYYVERAYRTPDYGHWERGSKHNDGTPEIHASSIGMAKAALEAINGCNLFGDKGASWSVIYVDIDAHNRNRSIFETLLPRESSSKGVDAALLPTISFPAFATHDEVLYCDTKSNVMRRLRGQYGFKRFGRDGYKCVLEDTKRQFYRNGEIKAFENVECEWPLFYIFMIIDGVFKTMPEQVDEFQNLLKTRIRHDECGDPVIPMYFYVPTEYVEAERREPGSQVRYPSEVGSGTPGVGTFLWNQALFIIAQLLTDELLHVNELDPIRRYLPSYNRPKRAGRYSAFQGTATDLVVQTVLIAESMRLQAMMATYGIQTQTPHEVEPVQIWSSKQMVTVFEQLGVNKKLGLKGRPVRPIGALGTSKYEIGWQYLQKVNESSVSNSFEHQLIFAQKYLLLSQYYTHQVDFKELPENFEASTAFVATIKALKILKTLYTLGRFDTILENCSLHLMMMEAAEWTGNLCLGMKLYRDGYAHLKLYLTCAQILGLASRCSLLVSKLAQFDLLCHELENAEAKAYGLEAILCLRKTSPSSDRIEKQPSCKTLREISDTLSLDSEIARMKLLDVPSPVPANLMGSPELVKSPFRMPFIMKHKGNCKCLYCHSLLLQTSLVELALIKAQLHVLKGENDLALSYFKGGMNLCERLKDMQEKLLHSLSITIHGKVSNSFFSLSDPFLSAHSKLSLAYGEFLFLTRHYELVQHMTTYSLESMLQSQECNLHISLEAIDKAQVLFTEMNKTPPIDQPGADDEKENQVLNDGDHDSLSPRIMRTPKSYRDCLVNAPGLNRNEDHLHLSKTLSPSVVLKLDAKLKSTETENGHRNPRNKGRKKIVACINFNDSSVNDCILESIEKRKSFESGPIFENETTSMNVSSSSDQLSSTKEQEIEIISKRIEDFAIFTFLGSAQNIENAGCDPSKAFSNNFSKERDTSHSTLNFKSKYSKKQNQISESENNDCNLSSNTSTKCFKSPLLHTSERNSSSKTDLSPVIHKSCQRVNNIKMKEESTTEMPYGKIKGKKNKPKVIIYTDSSDAEFLSPDTSVKPSQNTLKDLNLQSENGVAFEREEKLVTPKQRKTRSRSTKENALMADNCTINTQMSSQRKHSKVTKNAHKVPVITLKSSESDISPEEVSTKVHNNNCLPVDEDKFTLSSSPECVFLSPERKPALRKYERRKAVPLETADIKNTANDKTVANASVKKGVTRKKRNPCVL